MAELMGVSFATVNRWENGQTRPSKLAWHQILQAEKLGLAALGQPGRPRRRENPPARAARVGAPPAIDFSSNPEIVRVVAEGERLTYGHLFNPAFATEISQIDPLPHQRIAVYDHMLTRPACASFWPTMPGPARRSWPGSTSARCSPGA